MRYSFVHLVMLRAVLCCGADAARLRGHEPAGRRHRLDRLQGKDWVPGAAEKAGERDGSGPSLFRVTNTCQDWIVT